MSKVLITNTNKPILIRDNTPLLFDNGGYAIFTDEARLSGSELMLPENGVKYGYSANIITDQSIGMEAFKGCTTLKSIILPKTLNSISMYAFSNCENLESAVFLDLINESNLSYGEYLFYNCGKLQSVVFNKNISTITQYMFARCSLLNNIILPDNITRIESGAFYNCSGLKNITGSNNINKIETAAFSGCGFTTLTLPDSLEYLNSSGAGAFSACGSLQNVYINSSSLLGTNKISESTFYNCSRLQNINIDKPAGSIAKATGGTMSNSGRNNNKSVIGQDSLAYKQYEAYKRFSITGIGTYESNNVIIPGYLVNESYSDYYVGKIDSFAFQNCTNITNVSISETVEYIGIKAFEGCVNIPSIIIPNNVTKMDNLVFSGGRADQTIYCQASSKPSGGNDNGSAESSANIVGGYTPGDN